MPVSKDTDRTKAIRQNVEHLDAGWIRWLDQLIGKLRQTGASGDINLHAVLPESRFPDVTKLTPIYRKPRLDC